MGIAPYQLFDVRSRKLEVYRWENSQLKLVAALFSDETLNSPLLPSFSGTVDKFFPKQRS